MMYDWHGGWGWGGWLAMGVMMLVFWGLIVTVVVMLVRGGLGGGHHTSGPPPADTGESALRILDERFARGEIDAEEYRSRRDLLRSR